MRRPRHGAESVRGEAMRGRAWTAERIDQLRRLWAAGATANTIALRLGGMTRSAVLGKVFRLRLGADGAAAAAPAEDQPAAQINGGRIPSAKFAETCFSLQVVPQAPDAAPARRRRGGKRGNSRAPQPAAPTRGKTLLDLTNASCRWPHGRPGTTNFFFCGAAGADLERGIPYCARHMRRAYATFATVAAQDKRPAFNRKLRQRERW